MSTSNTELLTLFDEVPDPLRFQGALPSHRRDFCPLPFCSHLNAPALLRLDDDRKCFTPSSVFPVVRTPPSSVSASVFCSL